MLLELSMCISVRREGLWDCGFGRHGYLLVSLYLPPFVVTEIILSSLTLNPFVSSS